MSIIEIEYVSEDKARKMLYSPVDEPIIKSKLVNCLNKSEPIYKVKKINNLIEILSLSDTLKAIRNEKNTLSKLKFKAEKDKGFSVVMFYLFFAIFIGGIVSTFFGYEFADGLTGIVFFCCLSLFSFVVCGTQYYSNKNDFEQCSNSEKRLNIYQENIKDTSKEFIENNKVSLEFFS